MKNFIVLLLLSATLLLAACTSEEDSILNVRLTDNEMENIEKAKADLSAAEFDKVLQDTAQFLDGATYEAYVLARANLSEEHYVKAQEQEIFASDITYETYKEIAENFVDVDEFEKTMLNLEENKDVAIEMAYGSYAAKMVQYVTPLSPVK